MQEAGFTWGSGPPSPDVLQKAQQLAKDGFRQISSDPHWLAKVLLGGFLLINPFLVAAAPAYSRDAPRLG